MVVVELVHQQFGQLEYCKATDCGFIPEDPGRLLLDHRERIVYFVPSAARVLAELLFGRFDTADDVDRALLSEIFHQLSE